jgi:hypothetical protein
MDLLVFHRPPQPLDEHVVPPGTAAIHADRNLDTSGNLWR